MSAITKHRWPMSLANGKTDICYPYRLGLIDTWLDFSMNYRSGFRYIVPSCDGVFPYRKLMFFGMPGASDTAKPDREYFERFEALIDWYIHTYREGAD